MNVELLARAAALAAERQPFVLATVVWRRAPASGQVGAKAIIGADGTVEGWLGGACAQPTVVSEAAAAMTDGEPRLIFVGAPDELDQRAADGMVTVPMACHSEGAIEIYMEPVLPRPQVVAIGRTPVVFTMATLAFGLGWDVTVIDDGGDAADHPRPDVVRTTLDLDALGIGAASAIVVATQGHYDDRALEAALATDAGYVGFVASAKRAAATSQDLRERGVPDEQLARITAPAGLDLGAIDNAEIAIAILADLVARRAAGTFAFSSRSGRNSARPVT